ncbi:Amino acid permease-associated region OS=Tsukamurella paurometabola (strain ATCC 8368 / DSM/ CCUG 35730 / CIP 100753 / JCM 10117 / KCTC 9821 / NBRC 16120/ NCIMB 702349 / NCTC 13040) OX=521096 GN=Tpau_3953 PE=4 SV=1 [Tsukamurella paurometabola]|uniref:Amino acid permease-associated region n=1 Tax=Tsukamurella paurometabola (strain ATCC 8368 / DSM 20162 / CCUG 35730 / CIP 100753 / JCM 10117 / KCTC 9821 / NBRC 16120 / NCIMB 702349 / NCTC 13040) TaxID=521096 RepID=D5UMQ1_TSUPD|nr:APC family permease [Tsukamurella paurometabola]ADG80525.1 amino acid permease-associated region [Tsukamurella paurometabola DSM 20162]SUP39967.1 Putrescine importer PuuP [Tsukamurella paurometabola]
MINSPQSDPPRAVDDAPSGEHLLQRGLGIGSIVFMVVAAAAPLAVVTASVPIIISVSGSAAAPQFFLIAMCVLALFSVGFTAMSRYVPNAGAFYSYIQRGLGRHAGVGAATLALGSYGVMQIGLYTYMGVATSKLLSTMDIGLPWWTCSLAWVSIVGVLGYRDIELSSKVLGVLLVAETLAVVVIEVGVISAGGAGGLDLVPLSPSEFATGAPSLGLMFGFFSFIGFEATAVFRNEARDPERTIPRSTYAAVVFIGLFYAFAAWAVVEGLGVGHAVEAAKADPGNLVQNLASEYVSPILTDVIQVLLVTSFFACVLSFHNVITRYQFTLATKGLLPQSLAEISPRHRTPSKSSLTFTVVSLVAVAAVAAVGWDPVAQTYMWSSGASTLGLIALMAMTSLAVIIFFRTRVRNQGRWRTLVAPGLSFLGLTAILLLVIANFPVLVGTTTTAVVLGVIILVTFLAGVVAAERLRRTRPEHYQALLHED